MKRKQLGSSFQAWVYWISKALNSFASIILFFMMLLTIADVFLRKVFSQSILGTVEVTEFMMVILLFFAVTQTEILDGHVKVDLIMSQFGERTKTLTDMIIQFVCFLLFGLFTWSTLVYAAKMRASGEVSQDLWLPVYPFIYVVALGCALLALSLLIKSFMAFMRMDKS